MDEPVTACLRPLEVLDREVLVDLALRVELGRGPRDAETGLAFSCALGPAAALMAGSRTALASSSAVETES